jgi:hypothetical protein
VSLIALEESIDSEYIIEEKEKEKEKRRCKESGVIDQQKRDVKGERSYPYLLRLSQATCSDTSSGCWTVYVFRHVFLFLRLTIFLFYYF